MVRPGMLVTRKSFLVFLLKSEFLNPNFVCIRGGGIFTAKEALHTEPGLRYVCAPLDTRARANKTKLGFQNFESNISIRRESEDRFDKQICLLQAQIESECAESATVMAAIVSNWRVTELERENDQRLHMEFSSCVIMFGRLRISGHLIERRVCSGPCHFGESKLKYQKLKIKHFTNRRPRSGLMMRKWKLITV